MHRDRTVGVAAVAVEGLGGLDALDAVDHFARTFHQIVRVGGFAGEFIAGLDGAGIRREVDVTLHAVAGRVSSVVAAGLPGAAHERRDSGRHPPGVVVVRIPNPRTIGIGDLGHLAGLGRAVLCVAVSPVLVLVAGGGGGGAA